MGIYSDCERGQHTRRASIAGWRSASRPIGRISFGERRMSHAITVGEVLAVVAVGGGAILVGALCLFLLDLMNPFRSGH
jgi:hypothetical protein